MTRLVMRSALALATFGLAVSFAASETCAQEVQIVDSSITLSGSGRAELWFELSDDSEHRLRFDDGAVEFDGETVGSYETRGDFASVWRDFLREHAGADAAEVQYGLRQFRGLLADWESGNAPADRGTLRRLGERLDEVLGDLLSEDEARAAERAEASAAVQDEMAARGLQIVPLGAGFDVSEGLERLKDLLRRLGGLSESFDDQLAMIVHDDFTLQRSAEVAGHLALLDGDLRLEGLVEGDVLVLDGTLELTDDATIEGNIFQVGGEIEFDEDARIAGEILSDIALAPPAPVADVPDAPAAVVEVAPQTERRRVRSSSPVSRFARNLGRAGEGVMGTLSSFVGLALLGLLLVYFAQGRLETVSDTVRHEFARSFAMGLAGQVLFLPALLVLLVLVITWPIVPFFALAAGLAGLMGYIGVAHGAGEWFAQRRYRYEWLERLRRSNSYYYVISGLVLLMLPFAIGSVLWVLGGAVDMVRGLVAFVAGLGTWILVTAGFGSVLLTRAGGRSVVVDWSAGAADAHADAPMPEADAQMPEADAPMPEADATVESESETHSDAEPAADEDADDA